LLNMEQHIPKLIMTVNETTKVKNLVLNRHSVNTSSSFIKIR
jgi:hypothetical protein